VLGRVVHPRYHRPTAREAAAAFLAQPDLVASTRRSNQQTLRRLERELGADQPLASLTADQLTGAWVGGSRRPGTGR
jgi:hypothetical protein